LLCALDAPQIGTQARVGTSQQPRSPRSLVQVGADALQLGGDSFKPIGPPRAYGFRSFQFRLRLGWDFPAAIVGHGTDCHADSEQHRESQQAHGNKPGSLPNAVH
jgi:hypothetical protein